MDTKKLRQKILDLAIHGKLVPQDPNDEPASVLLERIRAEKERLISEGKIKRSRKTVKTADMHHYEQDVLFDVPKGWVWCTLDDLAYVAAGSTPNKDAFVAKGIPYIKMYNLRMQKIDFDFHPQYIKREIHEGKLHRSRTEIGDLLMNIVGPPLGKLAVIPSTLPEGNFNQAAVLIRPYHHKELLVKYLFYYLSEMSEINSISTKGSAGQVNISLTQSQNMRIPLPPLAEQQRIVEEIERWFKLIDIIEQGKADLQSTIKQAKNKILDLAIHGRLVPQVPNDEPASELLKRINPKAQITCDNEHSRKLPKGWDYAMLADMCTTTNGLWKGKKPPFIKVGVIRNANFTKEFTLDYSKIEYIDVEQKAFEKRFLLHGDIIIEKSGGSDKNPVGRAILFDGEDKTYSFSNFTMCLRCKNQTILIPTYLYYFLLCKYLEGNMATMQTQTTGLHNLLVEKFMAMTFPLPPLAEQKRIVQKIEELFSLLDCIEKALQA